MDIGNKIKTLRIANGLTQEELANRCELSKGFISQVERNITSPSIATLMDILQILGSNPPEFFAEDRHEPVVFTANDYFESEDDGICTEWVVPSAQKNDMEPIRVRLEADSETRLMNPSEAEFFGYVLKGRVNVHYGNEVFSAKKGDSFYYRAQKPHKISTKTGAIFLWISSPPIF